MNKVKQIVSRQVLNQLETTALTQIDGFQRGLNSKGSATYRIWFWLNGQFRGRCRAVDNCTLYIDQQLVDEQRFKRQRNQW